MTVTYDPEFVVSVDADSGAGYDYASLAAFGTAFGTVDFTAASTQAVSGVLTRGAIADGDAVTQTGTGATATCVHRTATQMLLKSVAGSPNGSGTWYPTPNGSDATNAWTPSDAGATCSLRVNWSSSAGTAETASPTLTGMTFSPRNRFSLVGQITASSLVWDVAKARLIVDSAGTVLALPNFCWATGLQIQNSAASPGAAAFAVGAVAGNPTHNQAWLSKSIVRGGQYPIGSTTYSLLVCDRVIAYGGSVGAVYTSHYGFVLRNCTLIGVTYGVRSINNTSYCRLVNCYVAGTTAISTASSGVATRLSTATSDATGDIPSIAHDTTVGAGHAGFTNVTPGSQNYTIKSGSPLYNAGSVLTPSTRQYADCTGLQHSYAGYSGAIGAVIYLTNGLATATIRHRNFHGHSWITTPDTQTFDLRVPHSGTTKAIAVLTDLHVDFLEARLTQAIDDIDNYLNPGDGITDVIVDGDITTATAGYTTYLSRRATSVIASANWHEGAGNHDPTGAGGFTASLGVALIRTDSIDNLRVVFTGPELYLSNASLDTLYTLMAATLGYNVIICNHFPAYRLRTWSGGISTDQVYAFKNFGRGGLSVFPWSLWVSGHSHANGAMDNTRVFQDSDGPDMTAWSVGATDGGATATSDSVAVSADGAVAIAESYAIAPEPQTSSDSVQVAAAGETSVTDTYTSVGQLYRFLSHNTTPGTYNFIAGAIETCIADNIRTGVWIAGVDGTYASEGDYGDGYLGGQSDQHVTDAAFLETNKAEIVTTDTAILAEFGVTGLAVEGGGGGIAPGDIVLPATDEVDAPVAYGYPTNMLEGTGMNATTMATLINDAWDALSSGDTVPGSRGAVLAAAGGAADPLLNPVPGTYAAGTAGEALGLIEDIKTKTDLIVTGTTTIVSPVNAQASTLTLVRGDDYTTASGQTITISDSGSTWPDLTDATVTLTIRNAQTDAVELTSTGSVVDPGTATQDVRFQPTAALTAVLTPGTNAGKYDVQATLAGSNAVRTLAYGKASVIEDQTRATV